MMLDNLRPTTWRPDRLPHLHISIDHFLPQVERTSTTKTQTMEEPHHKDAEPSTPVRAKGVKLPLTSQSKMAKQCCLVMLGDPPH